jgi:hypothetical protein
LWAGCGTTKWTDTSRTATEQLLITDSMDRAVSQIDFRAVAGKKIFVDDAPLKGMTDAAYLASTVKQQILASGGILKEPKDQADYVLELRAGALGTDRHDLLFGIPATTIPTISTMPGIPAQIPEIPFVKKTEQRAVTKIALFLYNRQTGRPVWQSGATPEESRVKAWWVAGAGPFQRGSIYAGTKFAGSRLTMPLVDPARGPDGASQVAVNDAAYFVEPKVEPQPEPKPAGLDNNKVAAGATKEQSFGGSKGPSVPNGAAAVNAPSPPNGPTPSGGGSPGVVPAVHTAPDILWGSTPQAGPFFASPAAWAPESGPAPLAPLPPRETGDRVLPLPPISPFDDLPSLPWRDR